MGAKDDKKKDASKNKDDKKKDASKTKDDKKKDASKNKDDKKKIDLESVAVVLKLDLHCEGCARKVKSSIRHFEGVESVNVDFAGNKITVTGKVDPAQVKERIEKKTKKKVEIVSPQVKKDDKKPDEKSPEKKDKGSNGGDGEKKKDGDKDMKKDEVKVADASKSVEVVNKMEYYGQNPFPYTMPAYNQSYYNQDYGIPTPNHGFANAVYANYGYAMQYSNGPPPPPPMYMQDSRGLNTGMFSDEDPNAACSIM